jgi:peptidoglycan/xylan/chitin deacetylase (PgdA/CDA1 family)
VPPFEFDSHIKYVASQGLGASLDELEAFVRGDRALTKDAVVITSDDGFRSVWTNMLPILRNYDVPAVAYVTPSLIRETDALPSHLPSDQPEHYMSWTELGRLAEHGVAIGCHSFTHRSLAQMPLREAREQAEKAMELFRARLGRDVLSFAYPYGTRADYSDETARMLREVGYTTAFTSQHGPIRKGMDPMALPRVKVESGDPTWLFPRLCHGAMDAWRFVDQGLWRVQLSR